jgi:adenosine deaminase
MRVDLILSIDRSKYTSTQAEEVVDLALKLRSDGLDVVGVDLGGDPNKPIDISKFRNAFRRAKAGGLGITIHFAEVPASSSREELEEILSWQPDRLGHVVHVPEDLRYEIINKGIHVELCLTCNILAGMLPDQGGGVGIGDHHFAWWYEHGRELISLGTDDVGVFGSDSSEEHYLASEYFGLDKKALIELSRNAIQGALTTEQVKREVLAQLDEFEADHPSNHV